MKGFHSTSQATPDATALHATMTGSPTTAGPLTHLLRLACFAAALICATTPVSAGPPIDVSFETEMSGNQKLVHAQTVFPGTRSIVFSIFSGIIAYPALHGWIERTTPVRTNKDTREFRVEFAFPWPIGRQWSRVEVRHIGNTIVWKQLEGTLKANHGRISFTSADSGVHIDYRAAIDIGLPELWTQPYKEKFIREFLTAACKQAETINSALASSTAP